MYDDNFGIEVDNDFDSEFETEFDAYEIEVNNREWINDLFKDIKLED